MPFNHVPRKCTIFPNHNKRLIPLCIWITKVFSKTEKKLDTPIQAIKIDSQDIGMKFGSEKKMLC